MADPTYRGRSFELSMDNGVVFHNTYAPSGTALHYETVAGPTAGASEDVDLHTAEVGPGVFLVGWVEASGMTVTHAMNLTTDRSMPSGPTRPQTVARPSSTPDSSHRCEPADRARSLRARSPGTPVMS